MKKILLAIALTFTLSTTTYSQVTVMNTPKLETVGKVAPMGSFIAELKTGDGTDTYFLSFRDARYSRIISIVTVGFHADTTEFETVYNLFMRAFRNPDQKYQATIKLGDDIVFISSGKMLGATYINVSVNGSYVMLTERQVNKLFGK